jgi:hypothetical protein
VEMIAGRDQSLMVAQSYLPAFFLAAAHQFD